jgi:hypothetical protein
MSYSRATIHKIQTEIEEVAKDFSTEFADRLPENNYLGFSFYTIILPAILSEISHTVLPQPGALGPAWNYLDAACSTITGINQLCDNQSHRPVATTVKGLVNVASGAQVMALTAVNFALLGGPAFAAAFGAGFLLSLDETVRAFSRKYSFEYWLKDSLAQLEKVESLRETLKKEMHKLTLTMADHQAAGQWALNRKQERLSAMDKTKNELEKDILFRVAAKRFEYSERIAPAESDVLLVDEDAAIIEKQLNACGGVLQTLKLMKDLRNINNWDTQEALVLHRKDLASEVDDASLLSTRQVREKQIEKKCSDNVLATVKDSFIWGTAFAGALLMCIPGCQLAGLFVMAAASSMYLVKHAGKIASAVKTGFQYFFGSSQSGEKNTNSASLNDGVYSADTVGRMYSN